MLNSCTCLLYHACRLDLVQAALLKNAVSVLTEINEIILDNVKTDYSGYIIKLSIMFITISISCKHGTLLNIKTFAQVQDKV